MVGQSMMRNEIQDVFFPKMRFFDHVLYIIRRNIVVLYCWILDAEFVNPLKAINYLN